MINMDRVVKHHIYTNGERRLGLFLYWDDVEEILGYKHRGISEDDQIIIKYLENIGAPEWVKNPHDSWIDEHGWGLCGPRLHNYEVIEDNGGGLHLVVFDGNGDVTFYASGYEHMPDNLRADIDALNNGTDVSEWDTNGMTLEEMRDAYKSLVSFEHGWDVVADEDGVYPMRMGTAARLAFGIEED